GRGRHGQRQVPELEVRVREVGDGESAEHDEQPGPERPRAPPGAELQPAAGELAGGGRSLGAHGKQLPGTALLWWGCAPRVKTRREGGRAGAPPAPPPVSECRS